MSSISSSFDTIKPSRGRRIWSLSDAEQNMLDSFFPDGRSPLASIIGSGEPPAFDGPPLVSTLEDIWRNLETLAACGETPSGRAFYEKLVRRGTCFVAYSIGGKRHFAPSRFVGYADNSQQAHLNNATKDGRITNPALSAILGPPVDDPYCEQLYAEFCRKLGREPNVGGAFGVRRKYWNLVNSRESLLDDIEMIETGNGSPTTKQALRDARLGQGDFRLALLAYWKKCPVTGCRNPTLLRASHIKAWRFATDRERLDSYNGILLSPNLDATFDAGLISFADDGSLIPPDQTRGWFP